MIGQTILIRVYKCNLMTNIQLGFSSIEKYNIKLRFVEPEDAAFILSLRTNEKLSRHISPTQNDLNGQIDWINLYKEREKLGKEYYFITIGLDGQRFGTTRLSELEGDCFELGSWLFDPNAPTGVAIKADIITREIGFDILGFDYCKFNVKKLNKNVLKYHLAYNPEISFQDDVDINFRLDAISFKKHRDKLIKLL